MRYKMSIRTFEQDVLCKFDVGEGFKVDTTMISRTTYPRDGVPLSLELGSAKIVGGQALTYTVITIIKALLKFPDEELRDFNGLLARSTRPRKPYTNKTYLLDELAKLDLFLIETK